VSFGGEMLKKCGAASIAIPREQVILEHVSLDDQLDV